MARNQNICSGYHNPDNYILVGGTYYKKVRKPTTDGEIIETLIRWDRERPIPAVLITAFHNF